ncbi:unnamed protein product, partial [Iphiclides podalirius]
MPISIQRHALAKKPVRQGRRNRPLTPHGPFQEARPASGRAAARLMFARGSLLMGTLAPAFNVTKDLDNSPSPFESTAAAVRNDWALERTNNASRAHGKARALPSPRGIIAPQIS